MGDESHGQGAKESEFVVELVVFVEAPSRAEAERYGEQLAGALRRKSSKRVKSVIVADVRSDDAD